MKVMKRMQNNIKGWFGQNLGAKTTALIFALFMWIYVMSVINPTISDNINNIPIELLNVEELQSNGIVIKGDQNHTVNVRVTGRSDQVFRISREDIIAQADLSGHRNIGTNNVSVTVEVDGDVDVEFTPRFIQVELEEVIRRQKNVEIDILGEPAEGYVLGDPRITPSVVWVEGPESSVNAVESVTGELELDNNSSDVVANLTIKALDSRGEEVPGVRLESDVVEVILPVQRTKTVIIEPNLDIEAAEGFVIQSTRVTPRSIMIQGPEGQLDGLTRVETELIERSDLMESETIEVELNLPEGIRLYTDRTVTVEIEVSEIVELEHELSIEEIQIENLGEGLSINLQQLPEQFIITLRGPEDVLASLNKENLEILLNLQGLDAGNHDVEPRIQGLNDLGNVEITIEPGVVPIEIQEDGVGEEEEDNEENESEEDDDLEEENND